jgi:hypothetical protein
MVFGVYGFFVYAFTYVFVLYGRVYDGFFLCLCSMSLFYGVCSCQKENADTKPDTKIAKFIMTNAHTNTDTNTITHLYGGQVNCWYRCI